MIRKTCKWFAKGHGCASRYPNSETILFDWNGKPDGSARFTPHVKTYTRNGKEHISFAALLRAVADEHHVDG